MKYYEIGKQTGPTPSLIYRDGNYYLFYKTDGHANGIRVATTTGLASGY